MTRTRRWRKATQATLLGWIAAFIVTSPAQIIEVLRNSGPDFPLLVSALGYGFAVWLLVTFAVVAIAWACAVTPISLFAHENWLVGHRMPVIIASICLGLVVIGCMTRVWGYFEHNGVGLTNFWIYAGFIGVFSGVTAYYFLRFLTRELAS